VNETVALLAARALKLRKAARDAVKARYAYVVLDGTLIAIDRVQEGRVDLGRAARVRQRHQGCPGSAASGRGPAN
jgi:hypothetical protein